MSRIYTENYTSVCCQLKNRSYIYSISDNICIDNYLLFLWISNYIYFVGSHLPVFWFLRVPLGHRLSVILSQFPVVLFLRLPLGHRLGLSVIVGFSVLGFVFLSHSPVVLFLRLPLGQLFLFSIGGVVSSAWTVSIGRGRRLWGDISLGGVLFFFGESLGRGIEKENFEEGDEYIEEKRIGGECDDDCEIVETDGIEGEIGGTLVSIVRGILGFGEGLGCGIEYENIEEIDG